MQMVDGEHAVQTYFPSGSDKGTVETKFVSFQEIPVIEQDMPKNMLNSDSVCGKES